MDRITDPAAVAEALGVAHHFLPGLYAKEMRLKAGITFGKHVHDYTHASVLAKGRVRVTYTDPVTKISNTMEMVAPSTISMCRRWEHEILALEDSIWYCIHPTDETNPDKIDNALIGARKD